MIIVPMWIDQEEEFGFWALLGSEPNKDSKSEWVPKNAVMSCVYAPCDPVEGKRFALTTLSEKELPDRIKNILKMK